MLSYGELLRQYIDNSELSLSQIESRLREKGLATNKAYISKLQNGKLPPAGDEINKALAEVLGGDEEELILVSYADKAPILREVIDKLVDAFKLMVLSNKEFFVSLMVQASSIEEDQINGDFDNIINHVISEMSFKDKIGIIGLLSANIAEQNIMEIAHFQDGFLQIDPAKFLGDDDRNRYLETYRKKNMQTLSELTPDEHLFLTKQLELFRNLGWSLTKE